MRKIGGGGDIILPIIFDSRKRFISYRFKTKKLGVANKLHRLFIDKLNIKVVYEARTIVNNERVGYGIIDVTEFIGSPEDIASAIYSENILNSEDELKIYESKVKGLGVVLLHYPLMLGTISEVVVFPEPLLKGILEGIKSEFKSAGEAFLYYMGIDGGIKTVDSYKDIFTLDLKELFNFILQLTVATGMCSEAKLLKYDEKNGKIHLSISELFECKNLKKEKPNSQFFRGFIAGVVSSLWQTDVKVEEVTCIAAGSGFCQFVITKSKP
ncbi:MAG: V4R domain-containing protein [Thermoproteota archaeon]|nr:hypothetical protein [Candidatus Brockarchaeota archaeon]